MASNTRSPKPAKVLIEQFCVVTGQSKEVAKQLLEVCQGNLEMAINMFLEEQEGAPSSSNVRDPIPPQQAVLVETPGFQGYPTRVKRAVHSVFDSFRDFQVETRRQEEMMTGPQASSKRKRLEDLFRPPLDLMFHGTFQNARDVGVDHKKWLMVNVQNVLEFSCQILNRDVWSNKAVKALIKEHFIFWQVYFDSNEGQRYAAFYNVTDWPYVAVLDPRTGESLKVWNRIDVSSFCDTISEFLAQHSSMEHQFAHLMTQKRAKLSSSPLTAEDAPNGSTEISPNLVSVPHSEVAGFSTQPDCNVPVPLVTKPAVSSMHQMSPASTSTVVPLNQTIVNETEPEPEPEEYGSPFSTSTPMHTPLKSDISSKSLVDADEVEQMAAAIEASLVDTLPDGNDCKKIPEKTTDLLNLNEEKTQDDDSSWKQYLGRSDDEKMSFLFRYPDGTREQIVVPVSSQIKALTTYVASKGYPEKDFEVVINFPRRVLSDMEETITVKDLSMHRQETLFVQLR